MKNILFAMLISSVLVGCGGSAASPGQQNALLNPLTAIEHGNNLANALAKIIIQGDPLAQEPGMEEHLQREIAKAKDTARIGMEQRRRGRSGILISVHGDTEGEVLYLENRLYFSPRFFTDLGPDLRIYLSTMVDPRDEGFPDTAAIDLGPVQSAFGAQTYTVPRVNNPDHYRTVALWDASLERLYGFAQISR